MSSIDKNCNMQDITRELLRHLLARREDMQQFSALKFNAERVDFVYKLIDSNDLLPALATDRKNNELSGNLRQNGNEMFKMQRNEEAVEIYTKSIACAEDKSECLALAYANRSAILFQYGFYNECLMDIDRAFENNYPERLKPKLLARQEKANTLKPNQTPRNYFEPIPMIPEQNRNVLIESAADSVEIKYFENLGRHVVATRDIAAGEIIAIEKPFCHVLIAQHYSHCHECLKLCYNLIPCENCTQTLYCSGECRHNAKHYHEYECPVLATVKNLDICQSNLLALKIALSVKDQFQIIKDGYGDEGAKGTDLYRSDRYKEIHHLVAHTEYRSNVDLLKRAAISAFFFHLIKKYTPFFDQIEEETIFKELVLLNLQIGEINSIQISELVGDKYGMYDGDMIGGGIYSFLSMLNNSCNFNTVRVFHGPIVVLRAVRDIKKGDQCCTSYGCKYILVPKSERRARLKRDFFFDCSCEACQNDWPLYRDLPEIRTNFTINLLDVEKILQGDINVAKKFLAKNLTKLTQLDKFQPNRNFAELQANIQECFTLHGNIRRTW